MKKIIFCLYILSISILNVQAQNVIELSSGSGISLEYDQKTSLETFASNTLPAFSDGNFKIIDASFYTYNDEMGNEREEKIWSNFQAEAKSKSPNYLLLGRQYFEDKDGFKLWIHLEVDMEDLECYDPDFKNEITEYIASKQEELLEFYEYLSFTPESNGFEIMEQVVDLGQYNLNKICCDIGLSRNECDPEGLSPKELLDEKDLKYYILGRLKCLWYSQGDGNTCNNNSLDSDIGLGLLNKDNFKETKESKFYSNDELYDFGNVHIYIEDDTQWGINCVDPIPQPNTREYPCNNGSYCNISVNEYRIGRFVIVVEEDVDLLEKLKEINKAVDVTLPNIASKILLEKTLKQEELHTLLYASYCNFDKLNDDDKTVILNIIVNKKSSEWYELWKWFEPKYPLFVRQLYDGISDKREFFEYQDNSNKTAFAYNLLRYPFSPAVKESFLEDYTNDYIKDYLSLIQLYPETKIKAGDRIVKDIYQLPYEVNKALNFLSSNYKFTYFKDIDKVQIDVKIPKVFWGSNSQITTYKWVKFGEVLPFDPIIINSIDIPGFKALPKIVPAILMTSAEKFINDNNTINAIVVTADILATISIVGNVTKLRHLGKVKLFFTVVEIIGETGSLIVQYTNAIEDPSLKIKVSLFFAAIEIVGVIGSLNASDLSKIKKKATDLSDEISKSNQIPENAKVGLLNNLAKISGKDGLLKRLEDLGLENGDLYKHIEELDEVTYAVGVNRYNMCSDDALENIDLLNPSAFSKFTSDLMDNAVGDNLVLLFSLKPNAVKAWKKFLDDGLPPAFRRNVTNLNQRSLIDEYAGGIASASNKRKGNFGEIGADLDLNAKGYESLQPRIGDIDAGGHNGLDGIYRKNGEYFVVEGKYTGSASLNAADPTTGLPRQMSDDWIASRDWSSIGLDQATVTNLLQTKNYKRVLAKVKPDGTVTYQHVGSTGYLTPNGSGSGGTGPFGEFIP